MIQDENTGIGEELADPVINLAAAIQIMSAVTANIGCIAGTDVAYDAVKTLLATRAVLTRMIETMLKAGPPDVFPPQAPTTKAKFNFGTNVRIPPPGPGFDALVERITCEVSAHGTQGWNITDFHVRDVLSALAKE